MSLELKLDSRALRAAERRLATMPEAMDKAARDAVKRTLTLARKTEVDEINRGTTLKKADIRWRMHLSQKGPYRGEVTAAGKKVPLDLYQHQPRTEFSKLARKPKIGVRVTLFRGKGGEQCQGVFVERGRSKGRLHIMARAMEFGQRVGRYPLHILYGPPVAREAEVVIPRIAPELRRRLHKRFLRNIRNAQKFNPSR